MLKRLKSKVLLVKFVTWVLVLAVSGVEGVAHAAATCNTETFEGFVLSPDGRSTLAVTKNLLSWQAASSAAKAEGGRLVVITSQEQNETIFSNLSSHFTVTPRPTSTPQSKAWINLVDPLNSPAWSVEGGAPVIMPSRFSWADDFSSYVNWAPSQPDGYCTAAEQLVHPDHNCYGEPWAAINSDGTWSDEGNHSETYVILKGVVEWPNVMLDCVKPVTEPTEIVIEDLPGAETGAMWCTDSYQTSMTECQDTTDGSKVCPNDQVSCNAVFETPVCPEGSELNTERDMCQVEPTVVCGQGYTWDASIDRCIATVVCPEGGVLNPNTDQCEKLVLNNCPSGYAYDGNAASPTYDKCIKAVECADGVFNFSKDRCESVPEWNCPTGFTYNSVSEGCDALPYCANGTAYNPLTDRCETALAACPNGYSYSQILDTCVVDATCPAGGSLNGATDKCESISSASCPDGTFYNAVSDKCESAPVCASPGAYSSLHDICLTPTIGTNCPTGYNYLESTGTCVSTPSCVGGSYSTVNDRCEASTAYSCSDASYSYNAGTGRCEKAVVCAIGMTYNSTYNVCTQVITPTCDTGYFYNSSSDRCEKTPECLEGTFNPVSNKCESGSIYAATGNSYCTDGDTLDGTTCTAMGSYAATQSGGSNYNVPIYSCTNAFSCTIGDISAYTKSGYSLYGYIPVATTADSVPVYACHFADTQCMFNGSLGEISTSKTTFPYQLFGRVPIADPGAGKFLAKCTNGMSCSMGRVAVSTNGHSTIGYATATQGTYGGTYSCPEGGTLSETTCNTSTTSPALVAYSCPSGGTLIGNICSNITQTNPTCANGTMDYDTHVCYAAYTPSCSQGTYDSATGLCVASPTCSNGLLDGNADLCYQSSTAGCASGYSLSGSVCVAPPACATGGSLDGNIDYCSAPVAWSCPSGYSYSSVTGQCYQPANCGSGSLNASADLCQQSYSLTCPTGYLLNGTTCQVSPTCAESGVYSASLNLCESGGNFCGALSFDSSADKCYQAASCGEGTLDTANDLCQAVAVPNCGVLGWDSASGVCYSSPVCSLGAYDATIDYCTSALAKDCGSYALKDITTCQLSPACPNDPGFSLNGTVAYTPALDKCVSLAQHDCLTGTTYMGLPVIKCEAVPFCPNGMYFPSSDTCYNSQQSCPLGDFQCHQITGDTTMAAPGVPMQYCSPNACQSDTSGWVTVNDTESGLNDKLNDGARGEDGSCLGSIYLYNGTDMRCRVADRRGMAGSYLKLIVQIILTATGAGAALAAALAVYGQIASAVIQAVIQVAINTSIDAVTTGVDSASLIQAGVSAIASGVASGLADGAAGAAGGATNGLGDSVADAVASAGLSTGFESLADPALSNVIQQIGNVVSDYQPAMQQGMLGNYSETKCCFPDKLSPSCSKKEIAEAKLQGNGACHVVGAYCSSRTLSVCMVKKETSCCFSSKLGRIFHEQGRSQLEAFGEDGGWGVPRSPNCRGFTPEEFQNLNFGAMDLTEYVEDMNAKMDTVQPLLEKYMETLGPLRSNQLDNQFSTGVQ